MALTGLPLGVFLSTPGQLFLRVLAARLGVLLAVAGRLFWVGRREQSLKDRIQSAKRRFTPSTIWIATVSVGLVLTLGSFIFYNTNMRNEYLTTADQMERKAEYERRYGQYRHTPQPQLTATWLHVELYPDRQQADIRGAYTLVNQEAVPLDTIHIGSASEVAFSEVGFNRPAGGVVIDKELSHHIYSLPQPLLPGDSLQLNFVVHYRPRGFRHSGTNDLVVESGTSFTNYDLLPAVGYQRHREIMDAVVRKKYTLPARPAFPSLNDRQARKKPSSTDQITFEAIVGTAKDELAVAPSKLLKTWTKAGRRYFHYKTDAPIGGEYAILSGKYAVRESKWNEVAIRMYYHPGSLDTGRMHRSVKASLAYYTEQFGPYTFDHLTAVERAGPGAGATADAGIIYYGEQDALMNPDDSPDGFDLPYYILQHEMAHQWWGMARLTPAYVEGAGVLIEGMAVYSGMQVLEKSYDAGHLQQ